MRFGCTVTPEPLEIFYHRYREEKNNMVTLAPKTANLTVQPT
jgi:hypothetical protein